MEYRDYYALLGVPRTADAEEIKRAYRRKARKFHPDVSKEKNAEARFKEVQEAYEVLKDTEKRAAYDQLGANWRDGQQFRAPPGFDFGGRGGPQGGAHASGGFSDFFSSLFGSNGGGGGGFSGGEDLGELFGRRAGQARQARARGRDVRVLLTLSLDEAHAGAFREIDFDRRRADGTAERRNLRVKIPAGVLPKQVIRLGGQGDEGAGGPSGDLLLEVQHHPYRHYQLEGRDLHLHVPLAPWEAALGATVQVPTLGGAVDLRIPAGSSAGRKLRLRGRGFAGERGATEGCGDLYVVVDIAMPPPSDDPAVVAAWEALRGATAFKPREGWE